MSLALEESNRARSELLLRESEARLRESEDHFSRAFCASLALMVILRLSDGNFVEANDAFVRWFGLDHDGILCRDSQELGIWVTHDDRMKFLGDLRRKGLLREVECQFCTRRGIDHQDTVPWAGFSPDGTRILTLSWDKTAKFWDVATPVELARQVKEARGNTASVGFSVSIADSPAQQVVSLSEIASGLEFSNEGSSGRSR